jgi:hypothetical protein
MVKAPILLSPADNHYQQPPQSAASPQASEQNNRKLTAFSAVKKQRINFNPMASEPPGGLPKSPASSISVSSDTDSGISVATQATTSHVTNVSLLTTPISNATAIAVVAPTARNTIIDSAHTIKTGTTAQVTPITVVIPPTMPPPPNPNQAQHMRNMVHHHHHHLQHHISAIPIQTITGAPPPGSTFIAAQPPPGPTGAPPQPQGLLQPPGGVWPHVEPVFHFGPGFERHQRHFCPTHSAQPHHPPSEHVVYFHVHPGVSVTFQVGGNRDVVRGKWK